MARLISGGPVAMDFVMNGDVDPQINAYLRQQAMYSLQTLGPTAGALLQETMDYVNTTQNSMAVRYARSAIAKSNNVYNTNAIYAITTLDGLQHAPEVMIPYIMAEPTIRQAYHKQEIEGYYGIYTDPNPGVIGPHHLQYAMATNHLSMPRSDGTGESFHHYQHLDESQKLSFDQKMAIQRTWATIVKEFANGEDDPTSQYGGQIG